MFRFICKTRLHLRNGYTFTPHNPNSSMAASLSLIRYLSSDANPYSFTVSYLINSCGLSPKSALIASKSVQIINPEKPDSILSFLENLGFSKPQISGMIIKFPNLLSLDLQKTISPKVELFRSKGASMSDLVKIVTTYPWILRINLENQLVPSLNFLADLFESEYRTIAMIKRYPRVLSNNFEAALVPKVNTLKEMGFNPSKSRFFEGIKVLTSLSKSKMDQKAEVYKRWGWSDKDITTAFKKHPWCMAYSEDKITAIMDFYVNKLGLDSSVILNRPVLLGLSLKKRLIPRGAVIQYLFSKGLVNMDSRTAKMLECTDKCLLEKFENCFKEEAPHLIKMYNDKLNEAISEAKSKS